MSEKSTHSSLDTIYETLKANGNVYGLHYVLTKQEDEQYGTRFQCLYYHKFSDSIRVNEVYVGSRYEVPGAKSCDEGDYINVRRSRNGYLTGITKYYN